MNAKRGRHHSAANGSRAAAWDRAARLAAIAALGLALSACGGGAGSASAAAATAQGSAPPQGSGPSQGAVPTGSAAAQGSAPAQGTAAAGGTTAAASTSEASGTSAGSTSSAASSGSSTVTSVTINWVPPTENTDGTWLTNLAGYNIHYGTASHKYTKTIAVSNPGVIRYVVENLTSGTYYFAVGAVNSTGTESPLSAEVRATVN